MRNALSLRIAVYLIYEQVVLEQNYFIRFHVSDKYADMLCDGFPGLLLCVRQTITPPDTVSTWPVTKPASSLAK